MNVLFIVPYVPNLIRVRPYNLIRHLAARGHQLTVLTLCSNEEERADAVALQQHCHRVVALPLPRYRPLWNCLRALPTRLPLQAMYCWSPHLKSQISDIKPPVDVVHVEHLRGARYGLHAKSAIRNPQSAIGSPQSAIRNPQSAIPVVWDSVDCISLLFQQTLQMSSSLGSRLMAWLDLERTRRYEGWLVTQFDRVLVTSEVDKAALEELANPQSAIRNPQSAISVLPNGVDLTYFTPGDQPRQPDTLVFSGKMSYHANVTAALHLINDVMPHVWAQRPDVKLWIVGKDPPREIRQSAIRNPQSAIRVTGTVPDIRPYLQQATAAVVPTPYGAGIQNKALEAMACETPVVASPQAVSALQVTDGQNVLVAADPAQFAHQVLELLENEPLRKRMGRSGREYVARHHDWQAVAERLEGIYQEAMDIDHPQN